MKSIYFLVLIAAISLMACEGDDELIEMDTKGIPCSDEVIHIDSVHLSPESVDFIVYNGEESLYFKNERGEEVKFEPLYPPIKHSFRETDFELECEDGVLNNYIFTREQYSVSHKCEELNLQYYLNLYSYNSSQYPEFVDKFSLLFHEPALDNNIDTLIALRIITSFKDKEDLLLEEFNHYNKYEFKSNVNLLNKTFSEVYQVIEPEDNLLTELYYNKEFGIVGFKDLNLELWVFDRIE